MVMDRDELIKKVKQYNEQLSMVKISKLERSLIAQINTSNYFYLFRKDVAIEKQSIEDFLQQSHYFKSLLPDTFEKLCFYLKYLPEYTCHLTPTIRMGVRSNNLSDYEDRIYKAIGSFYLFYGAGLNLKDLIYGVYRQLNLNYDFSEVIAAELLQDNEEAIQYCKDVLTSENNTAMLTRALIKAIEQSHNQELQQLLTQLFLAAKLQEGLRQSIIETVDENQLDYFKTIINTIQEHQLLRYSSVQRGVLTWIGIGYEIVEDKQIQYIFDCLYDYIHNEEHRKEGLHHENPLNVYVALYCKGVISVQDALQEAFDLVESDQRHIVACALIYIKLTRCFNIKQSVSWLDKYQDDEWIMALLMSEYSYRQFDKISLTKKEARTLIEHLNQWISKMKKNQSYSSKGFSWYNLTLYKDVLGVSIFELLKKAPDQDLIEQYLPYIPSFLHHKALDYFMEHFFDKVALEKKKAFMLKEIISNNQKLSDHITKAYLSMSLTDKEIQQLETRLKTKKDYARANIITVISNQQENQILESYQRLNSSTNKLIKQSALELKQKAPQYFHDAKKQVVIQGRKEGFGLYQPYHIQDLSCKSLLKYQTKGLLKKKAVIDTFALQPLSKQEVLQYIKLWNQRIIDHSDDEYEIRGEFRQVGYKYFYPLNYQGDDLDAVPLGNVWREYFKQDQLSYEAIYQLYLVNLSVGVDFDKFLTDDIKLVSLSNADIEPYKDYFSHYQVILRYYFYECQKQHSYKDDSYQLLEIMNQKTKWKIYSRTTYSGKVENISFTNLSFFPILIANLGLNEMTDEDFKQYFPIIYQTYVNFNLNLDKEVESKYQIPLLFLSRAVVLGVLPKEVLIESILDDHSNNTNNTYYYYNRGAHRLFEAFRDAYFKGKGVYGQPKFDLPDTQSEYYNYLRTTLDTISDQLLSMEIQRLNEETAVTSYVQSLRVIRGMKYLIMSLHVIENENIKRNSYGNDRNTVFSNVIRNCYPIETDSAEMLKEEGFPESRLVEVAMMAPQWIDLINEVLKWDGFKEACYYFIAHMKQYENDYKKAEIVKFTDLDPQDLNDGAFDMQWCKDIYQRLGEKRMKIIYQAAKFLCDNSFHTRARKYADACLSKVKKEKYLKQAKEKRNKDALNAYCIAPITDDQDLLERYTYVQQFLKESKKFGAQRQASEKRCCEIAIMNLARNSRYETDTRLTWMMESQMISQNEEFLQPQLVEDVQVWISIDENGSNVINVLKNNRKLKSIPAKYKNNELVVKIKAVHNMWNEQVRRARVMLENAMQQRTCFSLEEIQTIGENPIVSKLLSKLVLVSNGELGFYLDGKLKTLNGIVEFDDQIRIAHPYDLYIQNCWADYQQLIFEKNLFNHLNKYLENYI